MILTVFGHGITYTNNNYWDKVCEHWNYIIVFH